MALISLVGDGDAAVFRIGFTPGLAAVAGRVVAGRVVAGRVVAGRVVATRAVAGRVVSSFGARVAGARFAAFFSVVAVLGLAFAATLFTEVFGAWLWLDCAAVADRVLRFVAGAALVDVGFGAEGFAAEGLAVAGLVAGLADVGRAAVLWAPALRDAARGETRAALFRASAAAGLAFAGDRALVGGDFLLTLVAAAAALLVAAFFLGGMA